MITFDQNEFILFIAFVIPGMIAIKTYSLVTPSGYTETSKQIIDAITYSCFNYAVLLWPIYKIETGDIKTIHPDKYVLFYMCVLFVVPAMLAILWRYIRECDFIQKFVPHPTTKPWDHVFSKRQTYWMIVTLKNGNKIAGKYGSASFVSSYPAEEQIYLEEEWVLNEDEGFDRMVEQTAGIIIMPSEIALVELKKDGKPENE